MVLYGTPGVLAALSVARIQALLSDACQVVGAVRVQDTLRPTGGRSALVVWQTGAGGAAVLDATFRVGTARTWLAWVTGGRWWS